MGAEARGRAVLVFSRGGGRVMFSECWGGELGLQKVGRKEWGLGEGVGVSPGDGVGSVRGPQQHPFSRLWLSQAGWGELMRLGPGLLRGPGSS